MQDDEYTHEAPSAADLAALARLMPDLITAEDPVDTAANAEIGETETEDNQEADEFEYNLFSSAKPVKVNLADPVVAEYARPVRPPSYYKHTPLDSAILESVVITGEQVLAASRDRWASSGQVIVVPYSSTQEKKKRWRPSMARRKKFKALKAEAEQRELKRLELRSVGRNRGRGRGRGRGGGGGGVMRSSAGLAGRGGSAAANNRGGMKQIKSSGYPRKGAPAV